MMHSPPPEEETAPSNPADGWDVWEQLSFIPDIEMQAWLEYRREQGDRIVWNGDGTVTVLPPT